VLAKTSKRRIRLRRFSNAEVKASVVMIDRHQGTIDIQVAFHTGECWCSFMSYVAFLGSLLIHGLECNSFAKQKSDRLQIVSAHHLTRCITLSEWQEARAKPGSVWGS
jgi:hypothetical protein